MGWQGGQRGREVRREWNGEGARGGLSLHFCPGAPEFQVTPLLSVRFIVHCFVMFYGLLPDINHDDDDD